MTEAREPYGRALLIPLHGDDAGGGLQLRQLWNLVVRARLLVLVLAIACLAAVLILYAVTEKKYRATATVVVSDQNRGLSVSRALGAQLGGLASMAGISLPESGGLRTEAFVTLESRDLLRRLVVNEDLIRVLFHEKWDGDSKSWDTDSGEAPSLEKAVTFFEDNVLAIRREPGSDVAEISVVWRDPALSAYWANELVRQVNSSLRQRAIAEATRSIEFLEAEVQKSSNSELHGAIYALMEQQMAKIMLANVRTDYAFSIIDPAISPDLDDAYSPRLIFYLAAAGCLWALLCLLVVSILAVGNIRTGQVASQPTVE